MIEASYDRGLARLLDLGEAGIAGFILVFCRAAASSACCRASANR